MLSWLAKTDGVAGAFIKANRHPSGGNCFVLTTPGGKKLAGGNGPQGAEHALKLGFEQWQKLSEAERKNLPPGQEIQPPEAKRCAPPPGGLIVATYVRNLKRDADGKLARITRDDIKDRKRYPDWSMVYTEPARFNLWLTETEWKSLLPAGADRGKVIEVPEPIRRRIFCYHLADGTYGLPGHWQPAHIRSGTMSLTVEETSPLLRLRLRGAALLATDADLAKAHHGYDVKLDGLLEYDPAKKRFTRFDIAAIGDCWGGDWEGGRFKRPGRAPLGVAFQLVPGNSAVDRVPPLVHMDRKQVYDAYFR
ncbi:MAG: hypothetical protein FJ271_09780 [Planctomycetes bacterium]|nr:hypothetical protein [Planctomycetota bacterium]